MKPTLFLFAGACSCAVLAQTTPSELLEQTHLDAVRDAQSWVADAKSPRKSGSPAGTTANTANTHDSRFDQTEQELDLLIAEEVKGFKPSGPASKASWRASNESRSSCALATVTRWWSSWARTHVSLSMHAREWSSTSRAKKESHQEAPAFAVRVASVLPVAQTAMAKCCSTSRPTGVLGSMTHACTT